MPPAPGMALGFPRILRRNGQMTKRKLALAVALAALGTSSMWMSSASAAEKTDAHGGGDRLRRYL